MCAIVENASSDVMSTICRIIFITTWISKKFNFGFLSIDSL